MLSEYYRCPAVYDRLIASAEPASARGYFRFGEQICYGRLFSGPIARCAGDSLYDAGPDTGIENSAIRLPFDAAEVIANLRRETYAPGFPGQTTLPARVVRAAYYHARPFLPVAIRKYLQRIRLRDWNRLPFPAWPVDTSVEDIHRHILALSLRAAGSDEIPFIWFWPEGRPACAIMTHDVETSVGRNGCSQLMDLDESFGFRSSFQIVPEERYSVPESLRTTIRQRGFELNIHDLNHDGALFAERSEFLRRVSRINRHAAEYGALGFRSAALYRNVNWFDALGVSYDMSLPNIGHLDNQRGGCCTVMPYFIGSILELPVTTVQDYMLFHILGDYSINLWKTQIEIIMGRHGLISFIVHPDYLISRRAVATYVALLEHVSVLGAERNVWTALPGEVNTWWRQRSQMTLEYTGGCWRIQGDGKERARLAWACRDGDTVSFRVAESNAAGASPFGEGVVVL